MWKLLYYKYTRSLVKSVSLMILMLVKFYRIS